MTTSTCISRPFHLTHSHSHKSALCTHPRSIICTQSLKPLCIANSSHCRSPTYIVEKKPHRWKIRSGDEDFEGEREYEEEEEEEEEVEVEVEEAHNWNDYLAYNNHDISPNDFNNGQMGSFVNTQGWKSEVVVHHKINQDEFHKIRLLHCDFFIRKALDYDDDVFDFREMYVTPPEMDVYSIPEVVGKMPDKYVRLRKTDYGCYNVIELPVDRARDKFAKTEFEVMKVFLMKHYKNKRADDPEFVLDFEEIYVIDSKTKSISRANVVVNVPTDKNRDRRDETLIVRDQGTSFKIIPSDKRDSHDVVIEKLHWEKSRKEIETYLRSFRDFDTSNWF